MKRDGIMYAIGWVSVPFLSDARPRLQKRLQAKLKLAPSRGGTCRALRRPREEFPEAEEDAAGVKELEEVAEVHLYVRYLAGKTLV